MSQPRIWTRDFISISLSNFFVFLVFYGLLTTLPIYVVDRLQGTESQAGLIVTIFLLAAILVRPFSGKLLEAFGKKRMLLISAIFFGLLCIPYLFVTDLSSLLVLRFIHGITFSIATTATGAIAADTIPAERRGEGLGYYAMSMNVAVVVGPSLALTIINAVGFNPLFVIFVGVLAIGFFFIATLRTEEVQLTEKPSWKFTIDDLFEKRSIRVALIGSFVAFTYSSIISFISIYTKSLGLLQASTYFFAVFAMAMLLSRPVTGKLFDRVGPSYVMIPCLVLYSIGLLMLAQADGTTGIILAAVLIGLGYGTLVPSFQTLAVQAAPPKRSGHATATFFTFFDSGIALGSSLLGIVVSRFGYVELYMTCSALVLFIVVAFYVFFTKHQAKQQTA
ncbi:MFS transporter [Pontibacillus halophilus JSM 076056 = DSM 19796]|uniref:MFS transporter n=1 Tax=Pontibacillus halophilus JSM 076056 = DSM 19796 TaxID=1385510 RepID=A0A0A5GK11_9BACI|nr:MFS transporter [Pontibacillus halophilus]KGX92349.1 MFS transporter [Pontibacillus halophilus JSM 076056 = DSM 19796]